MEYAEEKGYSEEKIKAIHDAVWQAAYEIIAKKKATYYAIGMSLKRLVSAIVNDENSILTVSAYQNNEYGKEGMYIGVPAVINKDGIKEIIELHLNEDDQAKFNESCQILKENIENQIVPILRKK